MRQRAPRVLQHYINNVCRGLEQQRQAVWLAQPPCENLAGHQLTGQHDVADGPLRGGEGGRGWLTLRTALCLLDVSEAYKSWRS